MLFWHVGATTAIARYAFRDERMDLRFLWLGALLPDLIDTPIGLLRYDSFGGVRLAAHGLIFAGGIMVWVVLSTRRGRPRKRWMPVAIGILLHLFLDAMWTSPETLWWPLTGLDFTAAGPTTAAAYVRDVLGNPWMWAGEFIGLAYLVALGRKAARESTEWRRLLFTTGRVPVPIRQP